MDNANPTPTPNPGAPGAPAGVPRWIWGALGVLALSTAGLAGALIARPDAPSPQAQAPAAQPAPVAASAPAAAPALPAPDRLASAQEAAAPTPAAQATAARPEPARPARRPAPKRRAAPESQAVARADEYPTPRVEPVYEFAHESAHASAQICSACGVVEFARPQRVSTSQGPGLGAVAGGVVGGLLGNRMGHGDGRAAMTVIGALGGGYAGNEIEKRTSAATVYDVGVRMDDGSFRSFRMEQPFGVGARVVADGPNLRAAGR